MKRYLLFRLFVATCVLLISGQVYSQVSTSSIKGSVTDGYGFSVKDAIVIATHNSTGERYSTFCNEKGHFEINNLQVQGNYRLKVQLLGYRSVEMTDIELSIDKETVINCKLYEESFGETSGAEKIKGPLTKNITGSEIRDLPTKTNSLEEVLRFSPDATVAEELNIAGATYRQSAINIDGNVIGGDFFLPLEAIDRMVLQTSPFDIRNGGFTGASVDVASRSGSNHFEASAYSFFNDLQYGASTGGYIVKNKFFYFVNAEKDRDNMKVFGKLDWNLSSNHKFSAEYGIKHYCGNIAAETSDANFAAASLNSRFLEGRLTNSLKASLSSSYGAKLISVNDNATLSAGVHTITGGMQFQMVDTDNANADKVLFKNDRSFSAYIQDKIELGRRVALNAGVRVDIADETVVSPRISLEWDILGNSKWTVLAGGGIFNNPLVGGKVLKTILRTDFQLPSEFNIAMYGGFNKNSSVYDSFIVNPAEMTFGSYYFSEPQWNAGFNMRKVLIRNLSMTVGYRFCYSEGGYTIPHRITAVLNYRREYCNNFATGITVAYSGGAQGRYTYTFSNFDYSEYSEDVAVYIPRNEYMVKFTDYYYENAAGEQVLYTAKQQSDDYFEFEDKDKYLNTHHSKLATVNGAVYPWVNGVDVRISQDFCYNVAGRKNTVRFYFDILNIANLLNSDWGTGYVCNQTAIFKVIDNNKDNHIYQFQTASGERLTETFSKSISDLYEYSFRLGVRYLF